MSKRTSAAFRILLFCYITKLLWHAFESPLIFGHILLILYAWSGPVLVAVALGLAVYKFSEDYTRNTLIVALCMVWLILWIAFMATPYGFIDRI